MVQPVQRKGARLPPRSLELPEPIVVQATGDTLVPPMASAGVEVRLPAEVPLKPGDTLTFRFDAKVGTPAPGSENIVFTPAQIAPSMGKHIDVSYVVRRNGQDLESARLPLYFAPLQDEDSMLPRPAVPQAAGGAIDLGTFEGDATARISAWPFFDVGQRLWVRVRGTSVDGSVTDEEILARLTVDSDRNGAEASLPRGLLLGLKDGSDLVVEVRVAFDASDVDAPTFLFPRATYTVVAGELLPRPWVVEAVRDFIDPLTAPEGATARVAANAAIGPGKLVTLVMHGTTLDGVPVGHQVSQEIDAETPFPLEFRIPAEKIFVLGGSRADFYYVVETILRRRRIGPGVQRTSEVRTYGIVSVVPSLPPPIVNEAPDGYLEPDLVDDRIGVQVDVWNTTIGDVATLNWRGPGATPYSDSQTAFTDHVSFFVPKDPNITDNVGEAVSLDYVMRYARGHSGRSHPLVLRIGQSGIFIDFEDQPNRTIPVGDVVPLAEGSVLLRMTQGTALIWKETEDFGEHTAGQVLVLPMVSRAVLELVSPVHRVQFGVGALGGSVFRLFDEDHNLVYEETEGRTGAWDFVHQSDVPVASIQITSVVGATHIDHIRLGGGPGRPSAGHPGWDSPERAATSIRTFSPLQGLHDMTRASAQQFPAPSGPQVGNDEPWFPRPIVLEATDETLLPPNALNGAEVVLPEGLEPDPGDTVEFRFGQQYKTMQPGMRSVRFSPAEIAPSIGRHIQVYYIIHRSEENLESDRLQLYFAPLQVGDPVLPLPIVEEAVGSVIDMSTFGGDATIRVPRWPFFDYEQFIWIDILGTMADGSPSKAELVSRYVGHDDDNDVIEPLPRELLSGFKDGSEVIVEVRAAFAPPTEEAPVFHFPLGRYTLVVDGVAPELDAPWVEEAVGVFIDPAVVREGATARVKAHEVIVAGTRVKLVMHGITSDGLPVAHEISKVVDEGTLFPIDFPIPGEKIFVLAESTADFYYVLEAAIPDDGQARAQGRRANSHQRKQSRTRTYRIVSMMPSLPPPVVKEAPDGYLDPDLVDDQQGVEVDVENENVANGDVVAFIWRGTLMTEPFIDTVTVFAGSATFFVPKDPYVIGNDGGAASLEYVAYYTDRDAARSHSLELQIASAHEPALIIDLEDVTEQYLNQGQTLALGDDAVELHVDEGVVVIFDTAAERPPYYVRRVAQLSGGGRVTLTLAKTETWFELGFEALRQGGATIHAYDSEGQPIFEERITEPGARWVRYDGAAPAKRIVIDVDDLAVFDNLRLG